MIGRSRFAGGMSLRMTADGRPSLSGTVATQLVELDDLALLRPAEVVLPSFGRLPDLDLRMSAHTVKLGSWTVDAVAAGLILAERRFDLTVSQSSAGQIGAKLHLVATPDEEGVAVKLQASSDKLDVGPFLSGFAVNPGLTGAGGFNLSLEGHGENLARLERSLAGKVRLQMQQGGFSLALDGKPAATPSEGGSTGQAGGQAVSRRFSEASFAGVAEHGVLALTEGRIGEGASQILIGGKLDLADRRVDLSLNSAGEPPAETPWRLRVTGPWSAPSAWRTPPLAK
jgi:AsmA protein